MNINDFAKDVHANACAHGWWDEPRSVGDVIALCHSELSEALEEYRADRPLAYAYRISVADGMAVSGFEPDLAKWTPKDKPEGIATELADVVIRCLDWFGKMGMDAESLLATTKGGERTLSDFPIYRVDSFGEFIAALHLALSLAHRCWCNVSGVHAVAVRMAVCCNEIFDWAEREGVDMKRLMQLKHEYNKTRPYKHGKVM